MARRKPKTYEATHRGRKTRVTVPESPKADDPLAEALRENLSPHAAAAIASYVQAFSTGDHDVDQETNWFAERLIQMLGENEWNRLCQELGL